MRGGRSSGVEDVGGSAVAGSAGVLTHHPGDGHFGVAVAASVDPRSMWHGRYRDPPMAERPSSSPTWWQLRVTAGPTTAERLWEELGASSVAQVPGPAGQPDELVATFGDRSAAAAAAVALGGVVVAAPDEGEWADLWREWARVTVAGRVVVRPVWLTAELAPSVTGPDADGRPRVVIELEPAAAWGHGGHPSTALVLEALSERLVAGATVLDVGCGSGVLAVAAALLGASSVTAIDIDPAAVVATTDNAARNGVSGLVSVSGASLAAVAGRFDVVVANIGATVLVELAPLLVTRVAPGGWLVLSGLLEERWPTVVEPLGGLELVEVRRAGGWAAPVLRAPSTTP